MLTDLNLLPVYDSAEYNLIEDLQIPLLQNSVDYLRGVGYFTSGWLRLVSRGLVGFIERGGRIRLVLSPILEENDWESLRKGDEASRDEALKYILEENVRCLQETLEKDTLTAFAWMVADGVMTLKFALPRHVASSNYHDKVGIFTDTMGNMVAIHGSLNDSIQGALNGEAFSVFTSWSEGQKPYLQTHHDRLEALWDGSNKQFWTCPLPEAIRCHIVNFKQDNARPYTLPFPLNDFMTLQCPVELYAYQKEAMKSWLESGYCGFFEMATGTGKTITALATAVERFRVLGKGVLIVLVPYLHLLEQWSSECRRFGFQPILCGSSEPLWNVRVKETIREFNTGFVPYVCLVVVHKTAADEKFREALNNLDASNIFLIGDEAHGLGAAHTRSALLDAKMRLGLSATPRRWFDLEGTRFLQEYFGKTCFEYPLPLAIDNHFLTPYSYYPHIVHLTENERSEYEALSQRIALLLASVKTKNAPHGIQDKIEKLLIQRARIIGAAESKLPLLLKIISEMQKTREDELRNILVYCAPGTHRGVLKSLASLDLRCHDFVAGIPTHERHELLERFADGHIQILVAIRCLDEGVDIPSTRTAFILASSQNPREFIQRRGRILRKASGKTNAEIHDFLVFPDISIDAGESFNRSLLIREMPRFAEFSSCALNEFAARKEILPTLEALGMRHFIDLKPWEVADRDVQEEWLINEEE